MMRVMSAVSTRTKDCDVVTPNAETTGKAKPFSAFFWIAIGLVFAISAVLQLTHPTIADNSWLFVVDNRWLDGERIYRDFIETNPPMSAFLYMPAVLIERSGVMSADVAQVWITLLALAGSLAITARLLLRVHAPEVIATWLLVAGTMYACIPISVFAEREHIALILLLPSLALIELRAGNQLVDRSVRLALGTAAGLAVCIKPHFAVVLLLPQIWLCVRARTIHPLFAIENWMAGLVAAVYAGVVVLWFRSYLIDVLPMLADTYRAFREPIGILLFNLAFIDAVIAVVAIVLILGRDAMRPAVMVPLLAALGFLFAFFEQGKGWINHLYPTVGLVLTVFLCEAMPRLLRSTGTRQQPLWRKALNCAAAGLVILTFCQIVPALKHFDGRTLAIADRLNALHPHPRLYVLTTYLSTAQPLTRAIGAHWVGRFGHQFITDAADGLLRRGGVSEEQHQRLAMWLRRDRDFMAEDIRKGQPDIILVDRKHFPWQQLVASGHEVVGLLNQYHLLTTIDGIDILVPSTSPALTVAAHPRTG